ncbi:Hypothetical predicted protein [Paramuricea clavata]|uniref:Uncharacterized protein n=1 Tax=Paramuricea clavata TaxID=317549 RepID=A0A6S7IPC0_PARCT|nr:Hypothetical predicted protein [Paramuricea clavata]
MEKEMTDLETKLTQLSFGVKRTQAILDSGKRVAIKRHLEALQTTAKETNECKRTVEAAKITEKEELSKINEWSDEIDHKFDIADEAMMRLEKWLVDAERAEKFVTQEEQFKYELKLHEKKLEMQAELANKLEEKENISRQPATNDNGEETTFAKQQLGTNPESETKLLGLSWDKSQDTLSVTTNKEEPASTKRGALSQKSQLVQREAHFLS